MTRKKYHITAEAKNGKRVDLAYYSIKQAKYFNPGLKNFVITGYLSD